MSLYHFDRHTESHLVADPFAGNQMAVYHPKLLFEHYQLMSTTLHLYYGALLARVVIHAQ